jgi:response regulator NasT
MQYNEKLKITVISDYNNFKNNMYSVFSLLPIKGSIVSNIESVFDIKNILEDEKTDLIILNKSIYTQEEVMYLIEQDFKNISVVVLIDSYFKYKSLFMNFDKGLITIRRPLSINKFLEILKIALFAINKKKKIKRDFIKIRTLEMAKSFLAIYENMFEEDSHKFLEKEAMNNRTTLYDESLNVVTKYLFLKEDIVYEYKN